MGAMSLRRYIVLGIGFGLITLVLGLLFGQGIADWITGVRDQALSTGMGLIANIIGDPLIWLMTNPIPGALAVVVVWPLAILWLLFLFIMVLIGFGSDAARDLDSQVSLFRL
ncbi:MAG TPA: hypothetical protein VHL11_01290 [Phototrophicaceae bacterium]|jgi:hypothetical protein|nr:hypothetical protein [Phototrophicaceae bacterium]